MSGDPREHLHAVTKPVGFETGSKARVTFQDGVASAAIAEHARRDRRARVTP